MLVPVFYIVKGNSVWVYENAFYSNHEEHEDREGVKGNQKVIRAFLLCFIPGI